MYSQLSALALLSIFFALATHAHARNPTPRAPLFTDIPITKCPQVCYTDKYAKSVAKFQCVGREASCSVTPCGGGFSCTKLTTTKSVTISLESGGESDGDMASILINSKSVFLSGIEGVPVILDEGLNVAILDGTSGALKRFANFHFTRGSINEAFSSFLMGQAFGSVIIASIRHSLGSYITINSRWLLQSLGSSAIFSVANGDSFVMIGRVGAAPNSAREVLTKQFGGRAKLTAVYAMTHMVYRKRKADYNLLSAGSDDGNTAGMMWNGRPLLDPAVVGAGVHMGKGLNVAAVHPKKGSVTKFKTFNILDVIRGQALQNYVGQLPYGTLVFIVIKADGASALDPLSRWVIEGLGSAVISKLAPRDSFAMIGRVRAAPLSAIEKLNPSSSGFVNLRVPNFGLNWVKEPEKVADFRLYSGGPDDTNQADIIVNGRSVFSSQVSSALSSAGTGINIALVDEATAEFKNFKTFNIARLSSKVMPALVEFLKSLNRNGVLVLAVIRGEAILQPDAIALLQNLGASKVKDFKSFDSYAMIGSVGARAGHATEVLVSRFNGPAKLEFRNFKLK